MKKVTDDISKAFDRCVEALSLNELSRRTGIGIYTLRKFATRQTNSIREETWDKIYPVLMPYLIGNDADASSVLPPRIGPTARRHHDLVELVSDQKILLDVFGALAPRDRSEWLDRLTKAAGGDAPAYELSSLTADENRLLGVFDALPPERSEPLLLELVEYAELEVRKQRRELF